MAEHPNAIFYSYLPSIRGIEKGAEFTTNADGLRDREYSKAKPPGSYRIAWVGSSHDAGSGVGTAETYENVCEDLFAASAPPGSPRIEIVNFSVNGWAPIQKLATAELRVPEYEPDLVVYAACSTELTWTFFRLEQLMERHLVGEYPFYAEALTAAGIDPNGAAKPQLWLERQLHAHESEALRKLVARFGASVRAQGKIPLVVLVDHPEDTSRPAVFDAMLEMCRGAGIEAIDLYGALDTVPDRGELWIAPWDSHTNPRGHRILALKLMQELVHRRLVPRQDEASLQ
jgi:hypothetical protein